MSPTSTHSNTPTSAENGTARTTTDTTARALQTAPSGGNAHLNKQTYASIVKEMTKDGFTMVNRAKKPQQQRSVDAQPKRTEPKVAKKHTSIAQKVAGRTNDEAATRKCVLKQAIAEKPATIKGMLTTALGQTKVVLPDSTKARHEALHALQINNIRQKVQKALKVQTPLPPMQKDTTKKIQELT